MGKGSGYGKVILFGEHFVVHGVPGIVSAIDSTTDAEVKKTAKGINVKDERKTAKGYSEEKRLQQIESIERMLKAMGLDTKTALDIWIGGTLPGFSGLGASAASSVAIARAISEELSLNLSNEKINAIAYEGEKAYAGNPSGIDNTAATYGGLMWFKKNPAGGQDLVEKSIFANPSKSLLAAQAKSPTPKPWWKASPNAKRKTQPNTIPLFKQAEELAVCRTKSP